MATASKAREYVERGPDRRSGEERREDPQAEAVEERRTGEDRREMPESYAGPERRKHPRREVLDRRG